MRYRFTSFVVTAFPLITLYAAGCGGSSDTNTSASTSTSGGGGDTASSSSSAGHGGAGGAGSTSSSSSGPPFMTAAHPAAPQVVSLGGPVLKTPKVIPITYNADKNQADVEKFMGELAKSTFWSATTSEYGVGALTVGAPLHIATAPPKKIADTTILNNLKANLTGPNPLWGAPDPNAIYTFVFPEGSVVSSGGDCCTDYDGYHDEVTVNNVKLAYSIACTCPGFDGPNFTALDDLTIVLSHETVEAATDPFPQSTPAFAQTDDPDAAWSVITEGEVADMCEFDGDQYLKPQDMTYYVQRTWSNKAAAAGQDPCLPLATPPDVYFNSALVVSDDVPVPFFGMTLMGKGVKIPIGQSKTIDVDLFSTAPTAGPWKLKVVDYNALYGGQPNLQFTLDQDTGMNGDVRKLTIKVLGQDPTLKAEPFFIESTLGNASNLWMGMVGQ